MRISRDRSRGQARGSNDVSGAGSRGEAASPGSAGPLQKVIEIAGPDAVRQVMRDVLEADRKPDGELRQDNVFRYVVAAKE